MTAIVGGGGAIIGALITALFVVTPAPTNTFAPESELQGNSQNVEVAEIRSELEILARQQRELALSITSLENNQVARKPINGFVSKNEFDSLAKEMRQQKTPSVNKEIFEDRVEETLQEIRQREDEERAARKREETSRKVTNWLNLDQFQQTQYSELLLERDMAARELSRLWEAGELSPEEGGTIKSENRENHLNNVASILTTQQLELFNEAFRKGQR